MGKKIYILHGWAYSTEKWESLTGLLKEHGFEPVLLKIPGLTAPLNEDWTLENYVDWLKEKLIGEKDKIILLGHSNGGRIALAYTAKYPDTVEKLILIDSAGIYHNELPIRIKRAVFGTLALVGKRVIISSTARDIFYKFVGEQDYKKANPKLRMTMKNLIAVDLLPVLSKISVPTIIIWGKQDRITPNKDGVLMSEHLKHAKLYTIETARHSPQFTHAEKVADIIKTNI